MRLTQREYSKEKPSRISSEGVSEDEEEAEASKGNVSSEECCGDLSDVVQRHGIAGRLEASGSVCGQGDTVHTGARLVLSQVRLPKRQSLILVSPDGDGHVGVRHCHWTSCPLPVQEEKMRLPRRVPWASIGELEQLCALIYTDEHDRDSKILAINRVYRYALALHVSS